MSEPGDPGRMTPLGDVAGRGGGDLWQRARSRCSACGSVGLLDEGFLADTGEGAKGYVRWVDSPRDTSLFGGFSSMGADKFLVRAFRCRECRHLELFAEEREQGASGSSADR